jgi:hypothetical protein
MKQSTDSISKRSRNNGTYYYSTLLSFFLVAAFLIFSFSEGYCAQVTLTWDPNSETDLAGYEIYYGTSSGNYQSKTDVGNVTTYTVNGLTMGVTYYLAATAYNTQGLQSGYSNEVVYTVPSCTYVISPANASFSTSGGSGSLLVTTQAGCNWGTSAAPSWITVNSGSGLGSGTMGYTVSPNTGTTRFASLTVAGNVFSITEVGVQTYTITASSGSGGSISPSGGITVQSGASQSFTITPNAGYNIATVTVDGISQGAITSYSFSAVSTNHTINATFSPIITYQVKTEIGSGDGHGTISPTTRVVNSGSTTTFTVNPDSGYMATATGCGGTLSGETFTTGVITGACTIRVNFIGFSSCQNNPVRIVRTGTSYSTLQAAYNVAANNDIIQTQATSLVGNLSVNRDITVSIDGGYDCDFGTNAGNTTSLFGWIQTFPHGGTIAMKNFILTN